MPSNFKYTFVIHFWKPEMSYSWYAEGICIAYERDSTPLFL